MSSVSKIPKKEEKIAGLENWNGAINQVIYSLLSENPRKYQVKLRILKEDFAKHWEDITNEFVEGLKNKTIKTLADIEKIYPQTSVLLP